MHDVARLARVSVSTVSYVLTGTRPISAATRTKVLAAMAELDYQPNAMARGLATRRSRIVGLLMPMDERGLAGDQWRGVAFAGFLQQGEGVQAVAAFRALLIVARGAAAVEQRRDLRLEADRSRRGA